MTLKWLSMRMASHMNGIRMSGKRAGSDLYGTACHDIKMASHKNRIRTSANAKCMVLTVRTQYGIP